jgi:SAM-dependent methyltransferase
MYFQNTEQINQALSDMYNVFGQLPMEAQEFFVQKTHEFMQQRNNTSVYALQVFKGIYESALQYGLDVKNSSILEIGAGNPLGTGIFWNFVGAKKYSSIDKFNQINLTDLWIQRFEALLAMNLFYPKTFRIESLVKKNGEQYILSEDKIRLIQGSFEEYPFEEKSFDFIYSCAVLEHVTNIEKILRKMYDVLSDDGIMIHAIDLREHHTHLRTVPDKNTSVYFLKYSTEEWNKMYPPGSEHYINRLRASDFRKYFEDAGFSIVEFITTQEMELDEMVYSKIHPEFHRYSIDDLSILGIKVVLKKDSSFYR